METEVKRSAEFDSTIKKVVTRKSSFLIFHVPDIRKANFQILSEGSPIEGDFRHGIDMPPIESSRAKFEECKKQISKHDACFVLYDFYFVQEDGATRNILILICYLNDQTCSIGKKFFYSSNTIQIKEEMKAAEYITIHSLSEFTFEQIQNICRRIKKN